MLHLIKLAVGVASIDDIAGHQATRRREGRHGDLPYIFTRNFPRRAEEILAGGSLYWVIGGVLSARQEVAGFAEDQRPDGTACTAILLRTPLVPVTPRLVRAFQGWRYLTGPDAPLDLRASAAAGGDTLPMALRRELAALCLI